jgi:DNA-binding GntR family transcriptional regulator
MSPAHVVEPTYEAIKRRLMAGGWAPGSRLESAKIADQLGVSVTPVRDCLYRLAGERMVDFTHGDGFHAHRPSETEYRDMLELHLILLLAALATTPRGRAAPDPRDGDYPDRTAGLFIEMAARSGNGELVASITALGDRLYLARHLDEQLVGETVAELDALAAALTSGAPQDARNLLLRYHERRAGEAASYARLLGGAS